MPLHLAELKKHTEQNARIIELLEKLTDTQLPQREVVSNTEEEPLLLIEEIPKRGKRNHGNKEQS